MGKTTSPDTLINLTCPTHLSSSSLLDVGFMKRKMALSVKPSVEVQVEGDKWKLVTHTPVSTVTWSFTLGSEVKLPTNQGGEVTVSEGEGE